MPPLKLTRRAGPIGVALTLFDLWRRLPPKQRKLVAAQVRKHGPTIAKRAVQARRGPRR